MKDKEKKQNNPAKPEQQEQKHQEQKSSVIPLEEQMMRRQSAPQPTARDEAERLYQAQMASPMQGGQNGTLDGFKALAQVIGKEQVQNARLTLQKYKEGKANLEQKIIESEQFMHSTAGIRNSLMLHLTLQ